jgi:hypothetical protein
MSACAQCSTSILEGTEYFLRGNKGSVPLCSNCATNMERALQAETANPNVIGAVLLGLGAAVLASVVWMPSSSSRDSSWASSPSLLAGSSRRA